MIKWTKDLVVFSTEQDFLFKYYNICTGTEQIEYITTKIIAIVKQK
jgi:hypothetical protein